MGRLRREWLEVLIRHFHVPTARRRSWESANHGTFHVVNLLTSLCLRQCICNATTSSSQAVSTIETPRPLVSTRPTNPLESMEPRRVRIERRIRGRIDTRGLDVIPLGDVQQISKRMALLQSFSAHMGPERAQRAKAN